MQILLGETRKLSFVKMMETLGWGRICTVQIPRPYPGEPWAFDNGAFGAWLKDLPFPEVQFLKRLDVAFKVGIPYFGVVPDLVAQGTKSLEFSLKWIDSLPMEWPWYLAVQDGMTCQDVEPIIHQFDGIFLGGTNKFKETAPSWSKLAKDYDMPFHYGRAGTYKKLIHAYECEADSIDSSTPLFTSDRFTAFINLVTEEEMRKLHGNLTRKKVKDYIDNKRKDGIVACPFCNSTSIGMIDSDFWNLGNYLIDWLCENCGKMWRESYSILTIEELIKK